MMGVRVCVLKCVCMCVGMVETFKRAGAERCVENWFHASIADIKHDNVCDMVAFFLFHKEVPEVCVPLSTVCTLHCVHGTLLCVHVTLRFVHATLTAWRVCNSTLRVCHSSLRVCHSPLRACPFL